MNDQPAPTPATETPASAPAKKTVKPETVMGIGMLLGAILFGGLMYAVQEWRIAGLVKDYEGALQSERGVVDDLTLQLQDAMVDETDQAPEGPRVDMTPTAATTAAITAGESVDATVARVSSLGLLTPLACVPFHGLVGDGQPKRVQPAELQGGEARAKVLAAIPGNIPEPEKLADAIADARGLFPSDLCIDGPDVYVTYFDEAYSNVVVTRWALNPVPHLARFGPLATMDGVYGMYPAEVLGARKMLVRTGYGDAGHFWWAYYALDPAALAADLIEKCWMSYAYDEGVGNFRDDQIEWQCDRQYVR